MKNVFIALALCIIVSACLPPGRKLLNMTVANQGEVVFETVFDVADSSDESELWDAAGQCPFSVVREMDSLPKPEQPEEGQTLVELDDSVAISITWTGKLQAEAMLEGATVEMCSAGCSGWHLTAQTVRRAKEAAGL
ncbi:MAG: hypothetical protein OSB14_09115 [Planctomycetota bacterium]|nr:hypothetical protein [Planctomycetota bacterium]